TDHLHLVPALEEAARGTELHAEIVVVRLRAHLDLFDLDDRLLALGLALALALLVLELAEVEDLTDGGLSLGVDLDQVETSLLGALQRLGCGEHAQVGAILGHDQYLGHADSMV